MATGLPTIRRPEISLGLGLAVATLAYGIYNRGFPPGVDMRAAKEGDEHGQTVAKQSAWAAAATVAGVSILAKDHTIFIIGGSTVVVLDWLTRYNLWSNPVTGSVSKLTGYGLTKNEAVPMAETGTDYLAAVP
jgi:hypothetical protein